MAAGLCRDCGTALPAPTPARCPACGSPRIVAHAELDTLAAASALPPEYPGWMFVRQGEYRTKQLAQQGRGTAR